MSAAKLTDPRFARIWIKGTTPTDVNSKKLCAINAKAFNQSLATGTAVVPDCDNPLNVANVVRTAISKDASITGSGYFELSMRNDLQAIMNNGAPVDVVFEIFSDPTFPTVSDPANDGWYSGKFFLETFNIVANNTESYITVDLNFTQAGPVAWTPNTTTP